MEESLPNSHTLLDIRGSYSISKTDDELRNLLDGNDIFISFGVSSSCAILRVQRLISR
jgi:hypothetical protein